MSCPENVPLHAAFHPMLLGGANRMKPAVAKSSMLDQSQSGTVVNELFTSPHASSHAWKAPAGRVGTGAWSSALPALRKQLLDLRNVFLVARWRFQIGAP